MLGEDFAGKLQCDGYSAYPAFAKEKDALILFGCGTHARRGFFEAKEQAPQVAGWILKQIGCLYRWEPYTYLKDVLERLPTTTNQQVAQLTPLNWKQTRQSQLQQAA